jgi:cytochrome b
MTLLHRIRIFHATLAILAVLAYLTAEAGIVHDWLGYGVAIAIVFRLVWMTTGLPQLGLQRFYPNFDGLRLGNAMTHPAISKALLLGIAISLLATTVSGVVMDGGRAIGLSTATIVAPATAKDGREHDDRNDREEGPLGELHETMGNLFVLIVALHVSYLLMFKRPLALFMLFAGRAKRDAG